MALDALSLRASVGCAALGLWVCVAPATAATMPEFPSPATTPVAQIRAQFEASASVDAIDEAFHAAKLMEVDKGKVGASGCRAHADALDRAARHAPLSLGVWYFKVRCAEALGGAAARDASENALAAVLRDMLAGVPPDDGQTPIPIGTVIDGNALLDASGETVTYSYVDLDNIANGIIWRTGLRDQVSGRERNLSFELVQSRLRLIRNPEASRSPYIRILALQQSAKAFRDASMTTGSVQTTLGALDEEPVEKRAARIKQLAAVDDMSAAIVLADYCFARPKAGCTMTAVDDLLSFAEKGHAAPMVLLAYAYTKVEGIKHDEEAAKALMQGAAKKEGVGAAFQAYFELDRLNTYDASTFRRWAHGQLSAAADGGDALAAGMALRLAGMIAAFDVDAAKVQRYRQQVDKAGLGYFGARYALAVSARNKDGAATMRNAAAIAGMTTSGRLRAAVVSILAWAYETGDEPGVPADPVQALRWRTQAGMLGDIPSMRYVAWHYADQSAQPDSTRLAAEWFLSATQLSDTESMLDLAALMEDEPKGFPAGSSKQSVTLYQAIDQDMPTSKAGFTARRHLAKMLIDGRGIARDLPRAKAVLTKDAETGDAVAMVTLARALYAGKLGPRDADGAQQWAEKALAKADPGVATMIASDMFNGVGLASDRARAIDLWTKSAQAGNDVAWNDMGWELCTTPDAGARDPRKGLEAVQHVASAKARAGFVDTLAACQAAIAHFEDATASQARALAMLDPASDTAMRMRERLDMYKARRAYVQPVQEQPATQPGSPAMPAGKAGHSQ